MFKPSLRATLLLLCLFFTNCVFALDPDPKLDEAAEEVCEKKGRMSIAGLNDPRVSGNGYGVKQIEEWSEERGKSFPTQYSYEVNNGTPVCLKRSGDTDRRMPDQCSRANVLKKNNEVSFSSPYVDYKCPAHG